MNYRRDIFVKRKNMSRSLVQPRKVLLSSWLCISLILCSCKKTDDPVVLAKEINAEKFQNSEQLTADASLLVEWAAINLVELEMLRLADRRSAKTELREKVDMLLKAHQKLNDDIHAAATAEGITIPNALSDDGKAQIEKLYRVNASSFEATFIKTLRDSHTQTVLIAEKLAASTSKSDLQKLAGRALPELQSHLVDIRLKNEVSQR